MELCIFTILLFISFGFIVFEQRPIQSYYNNDERDNNPNTTYKYHIWDYVLLRFTRVYSAITSTTNQAKPYIYGAVFRDITIAIYEFDIRVRNTIFAIRNICF